ncbi:hypothetical protein JL722_4894 [Aureococcus anophagefferens]|nr:hypothetical protein JL722_4894 [Aureococcus anophagefferens]
MQSTLTVDNAPAKSLAYSNRVYLHPSDFAAFKSASPAQGVADDCCLLLLSGAGGDWVFAASAYPTMAAGKLGVASMQRRTAGLEIDAAVDVAPFTATLDTGLGKLRVSLAPFKAGAAADLDAAEVGAYFAREYGCQVFAVGQKLAVAFKKLALVATVEGLDFGVGGQARGGGRFGQESLFDSDFDFAKLGIGGLGSEFDTIFRRAFASRIYPSHLIQQMGITHVRGMLLFGPPGCGKTLIARQIGKVLNAREPKIVNGPEVLDKYVGASEEKIRELFADAEAEQKAEGDDSMLHTIIFDEMDAICKSRGSVRDGTGVSDSIVNQLLSKIDGVDSLNNILVIGMTNRKDMIDEAILRPGRLELHVEIGLPDEAGRLQILDIKTAPMKKAGRLAPDAVDALPALAARTKNFSGAELEGLVKSASSYALRRCVDVAKGNAIDDANLKVVRSDFDHALDSGEAVAAFGAKQESLEALYRDGLVDYGFQFREIKGALDRLVEQTRVSSKTPLMTVLLEGRVATGKTALAAYTAAHAEFPFVRVLSADAMIGYSESAKCQHIQKFFMDAREPARTSNLQDDFKRTLRPRFERSTSAIDSYKSNLSLIVVDDVERILEYTPVGPRFSNTVLQTLLVLLKKAPPEDHRKLMVIATTSVANHLADLQLTDAFNVVLNVPQLESPEEIAAALADRVPDDAQRAAIAAAINKPIGVKQLLMVLEMARDPEGTGVDPNSSRAPPRPRRAAAQARRRADAGGLQAYGNFDSRIGHGARGTRCCALLDDDAAPRRVRTKMILRSHHLPRIARYTAALVALVCVAAIAVQDEESAQRGGVASLRMSEPMMYAEEAMDAAMADDDFGPPPPAPPMMMSARSAPKMARAPRTSSRPPTRSRPPPRPGGFVERREDEGGYVDDEGARRGMAASLTLRVPVAKYAELLSLVKAGVGGTKPAEVASVGDTVVDVTGDYVDAASRAATLEATRDQLLKLMASADDVKDVLAVQRELSSVTQQLEAKKATMARLGKRAALSTIAVSLVQREPERKPPRPWRPKAWSLSRTFSRAVKTLAAFAQKSVDVLVFLAVFAAPAMLAAAVALCLPRSLKLQLAAACATGPRPEDACPAFGDAKVG